MTPALSHRWAVIVALILLAAGAGFVFLGLRGIWSGSELAIHDPMPVPSVSTTTPEPTATEPILPPPPTPAKPPTPTLLHESAPSPTVTPTRSTVSPPATSTQTPTTAPTPTRSPARITEPAPSPSPSAVPSPSPTAPEKGLYDLQQRLGVCGVSPALARDSAHQLGFGWYLDWSASPNPFRSTEVEYVPMIRLKEGGPQPNGQALLAAVDALPGALWLIGNEPDVKWQDNVTPDAYVRAYHDLYTLLKARDPSCQVAIGGVSQPTPLRMRYLDLILESYEARYGEPMPVDVWNVHAFILREERDSWGVDIPPGMTERTGRLREIADHDDLDIFRQQIVDFRRWMRERGQQDKPLIVTEYGILMPADYGFPPQQVERFMLDTFEFFRTASDPALGYPADGHRLVQRWCWYSLADDRYPTGNLAQPDSSELTPLGEAFRRFLQSRQAP